MDLVKASKRIEADPALKNHKAKYVVVTATTPTKFGNGKTTTVLGLVAGLAEVYGPEGKVPVATIRQPSEAPTFNIKGSAAGGGLSQCIPLAPFALGLTGDIDKITRAHNLAMTALTARMQHERNYDDAKLAQIGIKRLDVDPKAVQTKWAIDFCSQALRNITIGQGGDMDGVEMESGFQVSVSSELMAILAVAKDLKDMRSRIGRMILANNKKGEPITCDDLEVAGAMTAIVLDAINPNLVQTMEGNPVIVHAGPFANISIGQSSVLADKLASHLCDYIVTEAGFAADIGFEKFWNIKCRSTGMKPDAAVIVTTIAAMKLHGEEKPGDTAGRDDMELLKRGCENLAAHIEIVQKSGIAPVVCLNAFHTDKPAELEFLKKFCAEKKTRCAISNHWLEGGHGAVELAKAVHEACNDKTNDFKYLYELTTPIKDRITKIATDVYGAKDVEFLPEAMQKIEKLEKTNAKNFPICVVKTQMSLSHDPNLPGRPTGFTMPVRDVMIYNGAELIVPIAGDIKLLPGTGSKPGYTKIDIDADKGRVTGLF
eukprot:Selendium_serpulae@DN5714_c1_g1_i1.p1